MPDVPADVTMSNLIDRLWATIVGDPASGQTSKTVEPSVTALHMCYPGIPIRPEDFAGMRSDFNPTGDLRPTEAFSKWVDRIPDVGMLRFKPTESTVSDGYATALGGANANVDPPSPKEKDAYQKAHDYLYHKEKNPFTGELGDHEVETELYSTYKLKRKAYEKAVLDFISCWSNFDLSKPEDQRRYQAQGMGLQQAIDSAWDDWNAANRRYVEMALDLLGSQLKNMAATAITAASRVVDQSPVGSLSGPGRFYPAYTFPNGWWDPAAPGWSALQIKSDYSYLKSETHTKKFSASASFLGLFSFGGSGGWSKEQRHEEQESKNISITMKVAVVDIVRPWLKTGWMKCHNWYLKGEPAGTISSGEVDRQKNSMLLPLIPVQLIVARDIELTGEWSQATKDFMSQQIKAGADFGYGPFKIGGSYEQGDVTSTMASRFEGNSLKVGGMQIIGMVSTCPPMGAPMAGIK